jgi:DNA-binding transcriptional ArsR family regulator
MQSNTCLSLNPSASAPEIDGVFKALADPSRRQLLDRLHEKSGQSLGELCQGLAMARQSVAQHLGVLEAANLISVQWRGREKLHFFNAVPIHEIYERWIRKFEHPRLDALYEFKKTLEGQAP